MDMAEILGGLLKSQAGSGGGLGDILGGILGGGSQKSAPEPRQPEPRRPEPRRPEPRRSEQQRGSTHQRHSDFGEMARDAYNRYEHRGAGTPRHIEPRSELDDERAALLVRAMVNAAKADGRLDQQEQNKIFSKLGDVTEEEIQYLRDEFAKPLDVREFAWGVPLGLEEQVYGFSLMAIGLDERKEASYLKELAHGLRLSHDSCNAIHDQARAPRIF